MNQMTYKFEEVIGDVDVLYLMLEGAFKKWKGSFDILINDTNEYLFMKKFGIGKRPPLDSFCEKLRTSTGGQERCHECDKKWARIAKKVGKRIIYNCHVGPLDIAIPIFFGKDHVATIFWGHIRTNKKADDKKRIEKIQKLENALGFTSGELVELWNKMEPVTYEDIKLTAENVEKIVNFISDSGQERLKLLEAQKKDQQLKRLQERKDELTDLKRRVKLFNYITVIALIVMLLGLIPIFLLTTEIKLALLLAVYLFTFFAMLPYLRSWLRTVEQDIKALDFEIDLLQFEFNPRQTRAEKVLRINDTQLQKYYDLNRNQNIWVFGLGISCILLGFIIIGATLYSILNVASGLDTKIVIGVVGSIGSMLSSFVAAIYLKMHGSATSHLGTFHSRLVETHQLLLGSLLASRIDDDTKRWETLSQLALDIAKPVK